jgi:hypothetical protein
VNLVVDPKALERSAISTAELLASGNQEAIAKAGISKKRKVRDRGTHSLSASCT